MKKFLEKSKLKRGLEVPDSEEQPKKRIKHKDRGADKGILQFYKKVPIQGPSPFSHLSTLSEDLYGLISEFLSCRMIGRLKCIQAVYQKMFKYVHVKYTESWTRDPFTLEKFIPSFRCIQSLELDVDQNQFFIHNLSQMVNLVSLKFVCGDPAHLLRGMKSLICLTKLKYLDLSGLLNTHIDYNFPKHLTGLNELTSLDLSSNYNLLIGLTAFPILPKLTHLNFSDNVLHLINYHRLKPLFSTLTSLSLVRSKHLDLVRQHVIQPNNGIQSHSANIYFMQFLSQFTQLTRLNLSSNDLMFNMDDLQKLKALQSLNLSGCFFYIGNNPSLQINRIYGQPVLPPYQLIRFFEILPSLSSLTDLNMKDVYLQIAPSRMLENLFTLKKLEVLRLTLSTEQTSLLMDGIVAKESKLPALNNLKIDWLRCHPIEIRNRYVRVLKKLKKRYDSLVLASGLIP